MPENEKNENEEGEKENQNQQINSEEDEGGQEGGENEESENEEIEGDENISGSQDGKRFNFIEIILLVSFNGIGDVLELFDLSGIGMIVGFVVDFINGPATITYLWLKGIDRTIGKNAIAQASELIPFIDILPIKTTTIILTIIYVNNPQLIQKIANLVGFFSKFKKKESSEASDTATSGGVETSEG